MKEVVVGIITRKRLNGEKEYLLVASKRDFGEFTHYYYPPGGHIEVGENKENALIREIKEELSIDVKPIRQVVETNGDVKAQQTYWWLCDIEGDGDLKVDETELVDANYFTREEMEKINIWPATRKFFDVYKEEI